MFLRENTRKIIVGGLELGGNSKVYIQSMTNTKTQDADATVSQIKELEEAGCEIVRVAVPDMEAALAVKEIKKKINIPLVADIHFDYRLAVECIKNGVDKIRLNPGNIGGDDRVKVVADLAGEYGVPIRIGVNGGSLEKDLLGKYGAPTPEAIVESAQRHVALLEKHGFYDIAVSLKCSDVNKTIEAYRIFAEKSDIPLHLGITEAGGGFEGVVKSSAGIGALLSMGVGNTLRVSLTGNPVREVETAKEILKAFDLMEKGVEIISCPTCGRTRVDLEKVANAVKSEFKNYKGNITIAVMGCEVNGPGEAKEADIGVACGNGEGLIFKKGQTIKKVAEKDIASELYKIAKEM
ncbi:MAG: flavodoxin-dependent (E)-4-hydroxy-3-methylbut-2-enyl-diphosphate synthase [Clostridia bacterium]|nr:flavodoxin-dependent (E)-4-hydroxy-3-methylbut-2-enyl-diphosphate synthase [Clostridia bacterium]